MVSSHYHFAIFLVIFVATTTAAYASCQKSENLITCELDVDGLDKANYLSFLAEVRQSLKKREILGLPVLPPQNKAKPPQWLDLKLKAGDKETIVKIRGDNLYVVGYQTQQTQETPPKWYELKDSKYIKEATHLTFSGDYPSMLKAAGLTSLTDVPLSKSAFIGVVEALAGPKPQKEDKIAEAVILVAQMVSEACRFAHIAEYFANNLNNEATRLEKWMYTCLENRNWAGLSVDFMCYDKYKKNKNFVAEATATDSTITTLGIILDTKVTARDEGYDDELPNVIDHHAHLHDVVKNVNDHHAHLHDVVKSATTTLFWRLLVLILCVIPVMLMIVRSLGRDR